MCGFFSGTGKQALSFKLTVPLFGVMVIRHFVSAQGVGVLNPPITQFHNMILLFWALSSIATKC